MNWSIHPFPARMAPELALEKLTQLPSTAVILDPMAGSGTVLRQATDLGQRGIGFDMDPLAVLMSRVWTTPVDDQLAADVAERVAKRIDALAPAEANLPWIDNDPETAAFVDYWFAPLQREELRRIAYVIHQFSAEAATPDESAAVDLLKIALSRTIITKDKGASLARDVSHSRPHKIGETSDFAVRSAFDRSIKAVRRRLSNAPPRGGAEIQLGDARSIKGVEDASIDAVLTSPPYLNAIDYMRGHRMSLVWLGHQLADLREIRSKSIGSERAPDKPASTGEFAEIKEAMGNINDLPARFARIVDRYVQDIWRMIAEVARVLKNGGRATFVVGNSCLRKVFVRNSEAVISAARFAGLTLLDQSERPLPSRSRYLPMTSEPLGKRMRTETILSFARGRN